MLPGEYTPTLAFPPRGPPPSVALPHQSPMCFAARAAPPFVIGNTTGGSIAIGAGGGASATRDEDARPPG